MHHEHYQKFDLYTMCSKMETTGHTRLGKPFCPNDSPPASSLTICQTRPEAHSHVDSNVGHSSMTQPLIDHPSVLALFTEAHATLGAVFEHSTEDFALLYDLW